MSKARPRNSFWLAAYCLVFLPSPDAEPHHPRLATRSSRCRLSREGSHGVTQLQLLTCSSHALPWEQRETRLCPQPIKVFKPTCYKLFQAFPIKSYKNCINSTISIVHYSYIPCIGSICEWETSLSRSVFRRAYETYPLYRKWNVIAESDTGRTPIVFSIDGFLK
jgi:hypothetical protein